MEKKFYTDDFEQFLKETADDFRMYPSKRVWNSLYNNLHPGRKWPSLSVCLLLVSSIIFIGLAHKNEINGTGNIAKQDLATALPASREQAQSITPVIALNTAPVVEQNIQQETIPAISQDKSTMAPVSTNSSIAVQGSSHSKLSHENEPLANNHQISVNSHTSSSYSDNADVDAQTTLAINNTVENSVVGKNVPAFEKSNMSNVEITDAVIENNNEGLRGAGVPVAKNDVSIDKQINQIKKPNIPIALNNKVNADREWIEDYAFHNQPSPSLKSKLLYELYVTPSTGYRSFNKNVNYELPARNSLASAAPQVPGSLDHHSAFNLEAGYNFIYPYTKLVRFKAGVQFNYTNYIIRSYDIGHTTATTLLLNDTYSGGIELSPRSSHLSTIPNGSARKLNNYRFQVSLPFGTEMKIAGRHNFQWFVGATLQPTYVLFGNAYLLSSDRKNYVFDASFLRKWNLNAGVETFVSYRTKAGITFNAGPEFRYQFFSTYDKKYSYDEKLHSVGMKIGMVRNF